MWQVRLDDVDAVLLEIGIHTALLGKHGLALYELVDAVVLQYGQHDGVELLGILRPMHLNAVLLSVGGELFQVFVKVGYGVSLDGTCGLAQLLPLIKSFCHAVTLDT